MEVSFQTSKSNNVLIYLAAHAGIGLCKVGNVDEDPFCFLISPPPLPLSERRFVDLFLSDPQLTVLLTTGSRL